MVSFFERWCMCDGANCCKGGNGMVFSGGTCPDVPGISLVEFIMESFKSYGSRVALVDGDTGDTLTYKDLEVQVRQFAAGLQARGLCNGDVIAIFAPNSP